jgi:hypothetical protein
VAFANSRSEHRASLVSQLSPAPIAPSILEPFLIARILARGASAFLQLPSKR